MAKRKGLAAATDGKDSIHDLQLLEQAQRSTRSTATMSISLTAEERAAVEARAFQLKQAGARKDIGKVSGLTRVALAMMLAATDEEILRVADRVENLELRKARR